MIGPESIALMFAISKAVPGFSAIHEDHVAANDERLPHVLMADLVAYIEEQAAAGDSAPANAALSLIDRAYETGVPDLQELISVSFLENLDPKVPSYEGMKRRMGKALLAELELYEATAWNTLPQQ